MEKWVAARVICRRFQAGLGLGEALVGIRPEFIEERRVETEESPSDILALLTIGESWLCINVSL